MNDDSNLLDNSADLLKKELKILDSLGKKGNKNKKIFEKNDTTFSLTNNTDYYYTHVEE
jgi:hypothetical protein